MLLSDISNVIFEHKMSFAALTRHIKNASKDKISYDFWGGGGVRGVGPQYGCMLMCSWRLQNFTEMPSKKFSRIYKNLIPEQFLLFSFKSLFLTLISYTESKNLPIT